MFRHMNSNTATNGENAESKNADSHSARCETVAGPQSGQYARLVFIIQIFAQKCPSSNNLAPAVNKKIGGFLDCSKNPLMASASGGGLGRSQPEARPYLKLII